MCLKSLLVIDCMLRKLFAPTSVTVDPCFSGFSVGKGQEIRHGCQFLHGVFRTLGHLPGGIVRFLVNLVLTTLDCCMWVGDSVDMVSLLALVRVVTFSFSLLFWISLVILMEQLQSFLMALQSSVTHPLPFPRNFHLGRCLISLVGIWWLVPVVDPVFIFRIETLWGNGQRNEFVSQVRVPLSGVLLFLGVVFQRLSDGKG